jgi:hypothetical protein
VWTVNATKKGTEPMAYDPYTDARTLDWTWEAQCALWRERALHSSRRAEYYKRLAEAERNGTTITPSNEGN